MTGKPEIKINFRNVAWPKFFVWPSYDDTLIVIKPYPDVHQMKSIG